MASLQMILFKKMMMGLKTQYVPGKPKDYVGNRAAGDKRAMGIKCRKGLSIEENHVNGIPIEIYQHQDPTNDYIIFYIHGGGFNTGSLISARPHATELAYQLNTKVLSIQYKLAPEYKYPTQLEECISVYQWLIEGIARNKKIILYGDSAGGNLVLALTLYLKDKKLRKPSAVCVVSPPIDFTGKLQSRRDKEKVDCIIDKSFDLEIRDTYIGTADLNNPYILPIHGNYEGFPPIKIDVGSDEMLLDDSLILEKLAKSAGVTVEAKVWKGLCHVFPLFPIPEKKKYYIELKAFIQKYIF